MASQMRKMRVALQIGRRFYSAKGGEGHSPEDNARTWKNAFLCLGLPAVAAVWYNAYYVLPQHPERAEFVAYRHLYLRNRPFPWGDGNHSLFHNPYYNATPDGYDEDSEYLHPGKHH